MAGGTLQVEVKRASGLPAGTASRLQLELSNAGQGGTAATPVGVGPAPQWDQQFTFPVAQWTPAHLRLSLLDAATGAVLGTGSLPLGTLPVNRPVPREVLLQGAKVFLLLLARDGAPNAPPTRLSLSSGGSPQTSVGPASDVRPVSHRTATAALPPAVGGDTMAGSAWLELKVTSAKGLDSLPPCACCVRVSFGAWAAHTLVLPSHRPTLWNETFTLDAGRHGPVGEVAVVDVESGVCLATGSVDLREVAWGDAERCMHSVVVAASDGRTVGTVNLILRGAVGLLQSRWAPSAAADPAPQPGTSDSREARPPGTPCPAPPTPAAVLPVAAAEPSRGRRASTPSSVPHRSGLPPAAPPATSLPAGGARTLSSPCSTGLSSFQPSADLTSSSTSSAVFGPSSISPYPPISGFPATALLSKQDHATTPSSEPVATTRLWGGDKTAIVPPLFCHATHILSGAPSLAMAQPPPPPSASPAHTGHRLRLSRSSSPHLGTHTAPVRPATPPAALTPATGGRAVDLQRGGRTLAMAADLPVSGRHPVDDGPKCASTRPTATPGTQPPADPWEVDWDYVPPAPPTARASRPTPATLPAVSASPLSSSPTLSGTFPTPPPPAASSAVQKTAPPLPTMATRLRLSRTRNAPPGPTVPPRSLPTPHRPAASPRKDPTSPDPRHGPLPSHRSAANGPPCDPQPPPDADKSPGGAPALEVGTSPTCASSATWGWPTPDASTADGLGDDTGGWLHHCLAVVAALRPALTVIASALHWAAQTPLRSAVVHGALLFGCHSGWALRLALVLSLGMLAGADAAAAYCQRLDAEQRRTIQRAVDGAVGGLRWLLVSIACQSPGEWPAGGVLAGIAGLLAVSGHLPVGVLTTLGASLLVGLLLPLPEMDPESEGNDEVSRVRVLLVLTVWCITTGLMDPVAATAGAAGYLSALPFSATLRTFPDPATLAAFLQPLSRLPAPDPPHICDVNPLAMGSQ